MKTKSLLFISFLIIFIVTTAAQVPQAFNYQAVVRDNAGEVIANQDVAFKISILKGSILGTEVYVEVQNGMTNEFGLITLDIGDGEVISGDFTSIQWGEDKYFMKTELDPEGGTTFQTMGTTQLLSVPYALYAEKASSVENISYTETDPVFNSSIAKKISAEDTLAWTNKLDSESDPVFSASIAKSISAEDTLVWNDKLDSETDPVFTTSLAASITGSDTSSWNHKLDAEIDGSVTNELQALSISNDTIFLSDGGLVKLPPDYEPEPFPGTTLLTQEEQVLLNKWIGNPFQTWGRCYTKTIDGNTATDFNNACKFKGPSVTIIRLANGRTLGGYTENSWTAGSEYQGYDRAFIYSMDNQKRYPPGYMIDKTTYSNSSYGPTFGGGHDFYVNSSMDLQYLKFPYTYSWNGTIASPSDDACQELGGLNQSTAATISELEVWILEGY